MLLFFRLLVIVCMVVLLLCLLLWKLCNWVVRYFVYCLVRCGVFSVVRFWVVGLW